MEPQNINIEPVQVDNYNKIKKISKIFLIVSIFIFLYYLIVFFTQYNTFRGATAIVNSLNFLDLDNHALSATLSFALSLIIIYSLFLLSLSFYFLISFLPYYITKKFYTYKNINYKKQIKIGILFTVISFLVVNFMLAVFSFPKYRRVPPPSGPIVPCTPEMIDGVLYYKC